MPLFNIAHFTGIYLSLSRNMATSSSSSSTTTTRVVLCTFFLPLCFSTYYYGVTEAAELHAWMSNPMAPPEQRAAQLLAKMNISEKVLMLHGTNSENKDYGWYVGRVQGNTRLGIPNLQLNDGPQGFRDMNPAHKGSTTAFPSGLAVGTT